MDSKNRINIKLISIINKFLSLIGLRIVSKKTSIFENVVQNLFIDKNNLVIFDVGGHHGQSIEKYLSFFEKPLIHTFEPNIDSFTILNARFNSKNIIKNNFALSDKNSINNFYQSKKTDTSSILEFEEGLPDNDKIRGLETQKVDIIKVMKLDDYVIKNNINKINFLKIDVQGTELLVLKGAIKTLEERKISFIQFEFINKKVYKGQHTFFEYLEFLEGLNYELYSLGDISYVDGKSLNQMDLIFKLR